MAEDITLDSTKTSCLQTQSGPGIETGDLLPAELTGGIETGALLTANEIPGGPYPLNYARI